MGVLGEGSGQIDMSTNDHTKTENQLKTNILYKTTDIQRSVMDKPTIIPEAQQTSKDHPDTLKKRKRRKYRNSSTSRKDICVENTMYNSDGEYIPIFTEFNPNTNHKCETKQRIRNISIPEQLGRYSPLEKSTSPEPPDIWKIWRN